MTPEQKAAMIAESREMLKRLNDERASARTEVPPDDDPLANLPPPEDRIARWKREANEQTAREEAAAAELKRQQQQTERAYKLAEVEARLEARLEQTIATRLAAEREYLGELLPAVIVELRKEIQTAVGELRAEMNVRSAHDKGKVVDLPDFLRKRA
jgi:hypothetical protein